MALVNSVASFCAGRIVCVAELAQQVAATLRDQVHQEQPHRQRRRQRQRRNLLLVVVVLLLLLLLRLLQLLLHRLGQLVGQELFPLKCSTMHSGMVPC